MSQPLLPSLSITRHFANLADPRLHRRRRHQLLDIIAIAICGVICGCKSWGEIVSLPLAESRYQITRSVCPFSHAFRAACWAAWSCLSMVLTRM